jgi:prepilin-type N-terminal cleavage/methylation domain-containing protein
MNSRAKPYPRLRPAAGFTLIELLAVIAIVGVLAAMLMPVVSRVRAAARAAASTSNLRQLATAVHTHVADNRGFFPHAMSRDNNTRWHGARPDDSSPFDGSKGYLGPYLGLEGRVKVCPQLAAMDLAPEAGVFELSAGGYGYNGTYLGGGLVHPDGRTEFPRARAQGLRQPSRTIMFATTALARGDGLQEYAWAEPRRSLVPSGLPTGFPLQPSVHFRFGGKALVAWCDGRVSAETRNDATGPNHYGGDNVKSDIGWFGPTDNNGHWNPSYPDAKPW